MVLGGTIYSAMDGPGGPILGGTIYSAMDGPGGPILGGTTYSMTGPLVEQPNKPPGLWCDASDVV